jgi:hypothetical protein
VGAGDKNMIIGRIDKNPDLWKNRIVCTKIVSPKKGDYYLCPSGTKDVLNICIAENDFKRNTRIIIDIILDRSLIAPTEQ